MHEPERNFLYSSGNISFLSTHYAPTSMGLEQVTEQLKLVAHPIRLRIVLLLSEQGTLNSAALLNQLSIGHPQLPIYLTKMCDKGLVRSTRQGREMFYSLAHPSLGQAIQLLLKEHQ